VVDSQPASDVAEVETQLEPPVAVAPEPHAEPSPFDSDLFDDFPEPAAPTLRELLNAPPVAAAGSARPDAPVSPFAQEQADFASPASAGEDLVDSDDDWAAAGAGPVAWPDAASATAAPRFGVDGRDNPAEPLPLTIRAPEQSVGPGHDAATGAAKTSIFSLFGRGQNRLRKSA
jgi:hypothetical protein